MVFYRTWDFGNNFHVNPAYYLKVTYAIEPHPNLIFSIKHQAGDFLRMTPFNPTIGIGKHRQIIEVQCQREAYGKGAHPFYVGDGVINGWEEYAKIMKPGQPRGLRDVVNTPILPVLARRRVERSIHQQRTLVRAQRLCHREIRGEPESNRRGDF